MYQWFCLDSPVQPFFHTEAEVEGFSEVPFPTCGRSRSVGSKKLHHVTAGSSVVQFDPVESACHSCLNQEVVVVNKFVSSGWCLSSARIEIKENEPQPAVPRIERADDT